MSTPQKIPFKDIKLITNNFSDENLIGKGFIGSNYKGRLTQSGESIDVAVRRLDYSFYLQEVAFDKEIAILSKLKHENLVSMVGFCYENNEMIIVNKCEARGSLKYHLSGSRLSWMQRLRISVGVARALTYLHNDLEHKSVIHHNVNTISILLDENWEAKLSGFEYSMTSPAGRNLVLAYEQPGVGSYKADVFSFGIVLFEILCGVKAFTSDDDGSFQTQLAIFRYESRKLHKMVDPDLFNKMDPESFNIFSKMAYLCLKEQQAPPKMNQVLLKLERALKLQEKHENSESSAVAVERTLSPDLKLMLKNLEHMRVQLNDIVLATDNFASKYCIVSGGFGTVYKAELDHVDREYCCAIEGESKRELPKRHSEVAIKRIFNTEDESGEQGFYGEIEMLTKCKHSNIITLLGFCDEDSAMILIYEYATNGSLADYLQNKTNIHNDIWAQRIKICLDAAKGLSYLHTREGDRQEIVHRDIKSDNILLGKNFDAKIGDFGLSKFLSAYKKHSGVAGTTVYIDPQYVLEAKLKKEIDVYSFGVVLFEALCGNLAYDPIYSTKYNKGLALLAQKHVSNGTVKKIIDPKIEGVTKTRFSSTKGPDQDSVDTFSKIAYRCLDGRQDNRPTMKVVIEELEKALLFQENRKGIFQVPLKVIKSMADNFADYNYGIRGRFWTTYNGFWDGTYMVVKRLDTSRHETKHAFYTELKILMKYKHESVIGLVGYCDEREEKIILYESETVETLEDLFHARGLSWTKRLEMCIDIASGLDFLHGGLVSEEIVIHRDINPRNIMFGDKRKTKIAGFGHSIILPINQEKVLCKYGFVDTYTDPHYTSSCLLSKECDIYSFGVVLCDIMFWKVTKDLIGNGCHVGPFIKRLQKEGKLHEMVFVGGKRIAPQSLTIFQSVVIQCLHDNREERPTAGEVVTQLKEALEESSYDRDQISLEDIKSATYNFSDERCIGGKVYRGQLPHDDRQKIIAAKRFGQESHNEFYNACFTLATYKHENIINLEGYCEEMDEKIAVYEYASNGSLDRWLNKNDLTWMKRLAICIDIATGLTFLHEDGSRANRYVLHRKINSSNILLSGDWKAKIYNFESSSEHNGSPETNAAHFDIYPFGGVLLEILCGRLAYSNINDLPILAKRCFEKGKLNEMVFEGIKGKIEPQSYDTFSRIAHQCLDPDLAKRPTASKVLVQLKKALHIQEDHEIWKHKLPMDYQRIIEMSKNPAIYSDVTRKDLYDTLFSEGILLRGGKVSLSWDSNGRRNEMISARMFCYKNQTLQKWKLITKSRFHKVSMMLDVSNLMIQIKIKSQYLSPNVNYGVHLIFKFGDSQKDPSKLMYVNLRYKKGNETMHAYFAEQRDDEWMQIELFQFFNLEKITEFEVLLESFSRYYCGSGVIYVEGIEFRAIDNVKLEEMDKLKETQQLLKLNSNMDQVEQLSTGDMIIDAFKLFNERFFLLSEVDGKKLYMFSALDFLYASLKIKYLIWKPAEQSRFPVVIELLSQQVYRIKCKIKSQMLSADTDYMCYMVFKLSEKCRGLHCPVKVRNLLHHNNKEVETLYFRFPAPWNINDIKQVPKQREDEWMEVSVWKFNSKVDLKNECIPINLKLISYEGTMAGLIVCGLEFRPM